MHRRISLMYLPTLTAATVVLAACSGASPATEGKTDQSDADMTPITVGVIPISSNAPIYLGDAKGFFEEEGLELTIENTVGGAAAVPPVVSGDFDFADSNVVSLFVAAGQGLDVTLVAPGSASTGNAEKDATAVVVTEDSPITRPADLAGKTVSVNTLGNIGDITISAVVEQDGGDPSAISFVEVPFPEGAAALEAGDVDAAWLAEPFLTSALADGHRVITYNYADFGASTPIEAYFTTERYAQANPDIVERFARAMKKSHEYANANHDELREIVGTYTEIGPELRAQITLNKYPTEFDIESLQAVADATHKFGPLDDPIEVEDLISDSVR